MGSQDAEKAASTTQLDLVPKKAGSMEARTERLGTTQRSSRGTVDRVRRLTTETKQAFKTTEFWAMLGVIVAILVSAAAIKGGDSSGGTDEFVAKQAWLYVSIVAAAYMISRGLAKAGSSDPYTEDRDDRS
jgi:hypothetical protein